MKSISFVPKTIPGVEWVGWVMQGWGGVDHAGVGGSCTGGVGHVGVGWVMQGWGMWE